MRATSRAFFRVQHSTAATDQPLLSRAYHLEPTADPPVAQGTEANRAVYNRYTINLY